MAEQILYDTTDDFLYLKIPNEYSCIYRKILQDLSSLGLKGLKNCKELSLAYNNITPILDSWNMFQIALAAYELLEIEKADTIINFINKNMNYCCPNIKRLYDNIMFYGEVNSKPEISTILNSPQFQFSGNNVLSFPVNTTGHFIAISTKYSIKSIENARFSEDWLYNTTLGLDLYTREEITIGDNPYILWYCKFPIAFNAGVKIIINT